MIIFTQLEYFVYKIHTQVSTNMKYEIIIRYLKTLNSYEETYVFTNE